MKFLIDANEYGLAVVKKDESVRISSRTVAELFGKLHQHVLRDINKLLADETGLSKEFRASNFGRSSYTTLQNKKVNEYLLTFDGFMMLTMGYTTPKAMKIKERYILEFNNMKNRLIELQECRIDCPMLTDKLKKYDNGNPFIYSNEFNMINKLVLGMNTKDFRALHNIKKGDSIRPFLTEEQLNKIKFLQRNDSVLLDVVSDIQVRKSLLASQLEEMYHD